MSALRLRALLTLWATLIGVVLVIVPLAIVAMVVAGFDLARLFQLATIGVRNVSIPFLKGVMDRGVALSVGYIVLNGGVTAVLWGFVLLARYGDPALAGRVPRWLAGNSSRDPSLALFLPFRGFRRIPSGELRALYPRLVAIPFIPPAGLGFVFAAVLVRGAVEKGIGARIAEQVATLLPHGLFELTAVFLPLAVLYAIYLETRPDLEAGRSEAVWAIVRARTSLASVGGLMRLSALFIVVAGLVEAHVSERVGALVRGWLA